MFSGPGKIITPDVKVKPMDSSWIIAHGGIVGQPNDNVNTAIMVERVFAAFTWIKTAFDPATGWIWLLYIHPWPRLHH
jgi:hypothetical protein